MNIIKYIILGIIQGFTEPLPVSSSGHLRIIESIINDKMFDDLNFEIIVNFGSLIAIIIIYRDEILSIIKDFFIYILKKENTSKLNFNYSIKIIISTIPVIIVGFIIKDKIEDYFSIKFIGLALLMTSFLLFIIKDKIGYKTKENITFKDSIIIGFYQVIALLPGISRSGTTLVGCMNQNLTRETALNYSFMLYIPVSIGSLILGLADLLKSNINGLLVPYLVSFFVSAIVTFYSTKLFINITKKGKLIYFSIYCLIVGLIVIFTK